MNRSAAVLAASVLALGLAAATYVSARREVADLRAKLERSNSKLPYHVHSDIRLAIIRSQIQRMDRPIVVLGDSIVEMAILPATLCGRPVLNAGIGGAGIRFLTDHIDRILAGTKPSLIVVSIGVNEIIPRTSLAKFKDLYDDLRSAISHPAIYGTVTPLDDFDVAPYNEIIRQSGPNTFELVSDGTTADGAHLTPDGYASWTAALTRGVAAVCDTTESEKP